MVTVAPVSRAQPVRAERGIRHSKSVQTIFVKRCFIMMYRQPLGFIFALLLSVLLFFQSFHLLERSVNCVSEIIHNGAELRSGQGRSNHGISVCI